MRTIKFRGKRVDNGEWVYGAYFCLHHDDERKHIHHFIIPNDISIPKDKPIGEIQIEVIAETVGQFTELFDRFKYEVYEGDIIQYKSKITNKALPNPIRFGKVIYKNAEVYVDEGGINLFTLFGTLKMASSVKKVGNIYDNSNLLVSVNE